MKKNMITLIMILVLGVSCLTGCSYETETVNNELNDTNKNSVVLQDNKYADGQTKVIDEINIPGESFTILCEYDTGDYPLKNWRVTANKNFNMTVKTNGLPDGYTVHIEHVHADVLLKSTDAQLDGITQDTMDDSDHRMPTKGFPISDNITYNNIFAIEGYTCQFYEIWGYSYGEYGHVSSSYKKLTEANILKSGCYAEKIAIVYDLIITPPDMEDGYVRSVYSEILIPLNTLVTYEISDIGSDEVYYEVRDAITGEVVKTYYPDETNN